MTPEAMQSIAELREQFYDLFIAAMEVPVKLTKGTTSNSQIASWVDKQQRLNYLSIYAYTAPDALIPERPLILRISINRSRGNTPMGVWRKSSAKLNQDWTLELTLLPEEILKFATWVIHWIQSQDQDSRPVMTDPPYPFQTEPSEISSPFDLWTQDAWSCSEQQDDDPTPSFLV